MRRHLARSFCLLALVVAVQACVRVVPAAPFTSSDLALLLVQVQVRLDTLCGDSSCSPIIVAHTVYSSRADATTLSLSTPGVFALRDSTFEAGGRSVQVLDLTHDVMAAHMTDDAIWGVTFLRTARSASGCVPLGLELSGGGGRLGGAVTVTVLGSVCNEGGRRVAYIETLYDH
jgi:hypothetical protein